MIGHIKWGLTYSFIVSLFCTVVSAQLPKRSVQDIQAAGTRFGHCVNGNIDVNNDGVRDIIVGATHDSSKGPKAGAIYVYSGLDNQLLFKAFGKGSEDQFGHTVASAGDINGDGISVIHINNMRFIMVNLINHNYN